MAMNWEGHDDWMAEIPASLIYEQATGPARPLPPAPCGDRQALPDNPYDQVPLGCPRQSPAASR